MPTAEYIPNNTTPSAEVTAPGTAFSFSQPPEVDDLIFIQAGFLPRDQEYYWTEQWQAGERETLAEIEAGKGVEFDNAEDLIRWLYKTD